MARAEVVGPSLVQALHANTVPIGKAVSSAFQIWQLFSIPDIFYYHLPPKSHPGGKQLMQVILGLGRETEGSAARFLKTKDEWSSFSFELQVLQQDTIIFHTRSTTFVSFSFLWRIWNRLVSHSCTLRTITTMNHTKQHINCHVWLSSAPAYHPCIFRTDSLAFNRWSRMCYDDLFTSRILLLLGGQMNYCLSIPICAIHYSPAGMELCIRSTVTRRNRNAYLYDLILAT